MTLTPEQQSKLDEYFEPIRQMLRELEIPKPTIDSYEANQLIADTRSKLRCIDMNLFSAYHLLADFHNTEPIRSSYNPAWVARATRQRFTTDDL